MGTKISELDAAASALTSDEVPSNQGGTTKKLTVAQIVAAGHAITGSQASPIARATITLPIVSAASETQFVVGDSAPLVLGGTPLIQAGTEVGQRLTLVGCDDNNTLTLPEGAGVTLNGACILKDGATIALVWGGTTWVEVARNDK